MVVTGVSQKKLSKDGSHNHSLSDEYIAGFFDGEGCVGIYKVTSKRKSTSWQPRITMAQKPREVLDLIQSTLGMGNVRERTEGRHTLVIYGHDNMRKFLRRIGPHCVVKRSDLARLEDFLDRKEGVSKRSGRSRVQPKPH